MKRYDIAVLVPCYKRPEYTKKCIESLEKSMSSHNVVFYLYDDYSQDETKNILENASINKVLRFNETNKGLRAVVIDFLREMQNKKQYDIIGKIDNDCTVPNTFIDDIIIAFENSTADILSPDVYPSCAANKYGDIKNKTEFITPSKVVGGLWFMKRHVIDGVDFENHDIYGIKGAWNVLYQIIQEKDPVVAWAHKVIIQDIGHWSGEHPEHIKTCEHETYYHEVGRNIAW